LSQTGGDVSEMILNMGTLYKTIKTPAITQLLHLRTDSKYNVTYLYVSTAQTNIHMEDTESMLRLIRNLPLTPTDILHMARHILSSFWKLIPVLKQRFIRLMSTCHEF